MRKHEGPNRSEPAHDHDPADLVRAVRERRFAAGLNCPACGSDRVIRWGRFAERQRYRCRACARCFSDLTDTPLSHLKRLDVWTTYLGCMARSATVRDSARTADMAVSTSFRWRHRVLIAIRDAEYPTLTGLVEFAHRHLRYNAKGPARRVTDVEPIGNHEPVDSDWSRPGLVLVVARDRTGRTAADLFETRFYTGEQLCAAFDHLLVGKATMLCNTGRYGPFARLTATPDGSARRLVRVPQGCPRTYDLGHTGNARGWIARFGNWLVPFRGVATRYLLNYVAWRQTLDGIESGPWLAALVPAGTDRQSPTTPENTDAQRQADNATSAAHDNGVPCN